MHITEGSFFNLRISASLKHLAGTTIITGISITGINSVLAFWTMKASRTPTFIIKARTGPTLSSILAWPSVAKVALGQNVIWYSLWLGGATFSL